MKSGLGLIPHGAIGPIEYFRFDFLPAVRREAMQYRVIRMSVSQQLLIHDEASECVEPVISLGFLPHAGKYIRADDLGVAHSFARVTN